jgi:type I restriction enzyme R subunit
MTYFNEENTVEQLVLDTLSNRDNQWRVAEPKADYLDSHLTLQISSLKWRFVSAEELPRQHSDVLVESTVRDALIRPNPEIKVQPDRADEAPYYLNQIKMDIDNFVN